MCGEAGGCKRSAAEWVRIAQLSFAFRIQIQISQPHPFCRVPRQSRASGTTTALRLFRHKEEADTNLHSLARISNGVIYTFLPSVAEQAEAFSRYASS